MGISLCNLGWWNHTEMTYEHQIKVILISTQVDQEWLLKVILVSLIKTMGLASIVLHKLCIDKGVFTPTKLDLTSDHMTDVEVKVNSYT